MRTAPRVTHPRLPRARPQLCGRDSREQNRSSQKKWTSCRNSEIIQPRSLNRRRFTLKASNMLVIFYIVGVKHCLIKNLSCAHMFSILKMYVVMYAISPPLFRHQATSMKKEKEIKRQTLLELVDYVNTSAGQKIFTEPSMPVFSRSVVTVNFRSLDGT